MLPWLLDGLVLLILFIIYEGQPQTPFGIQLGSFLPFDKNVGKSFYQSHLDLHLSRLNWFTSSVACPIKNKESTKREREYFFS